MSAIQFGDTRLPQRFWSKVHVESSGCWVWDASKLPTGYGRFSWRGVASYAHRVAFTELSGPIDKGLDCDHLCRRPECVNPAHIEPVTPRENVLRGVGPAAVNHRKTHCPYGHQLIRSGTVRVCRECRSIKDRQRYAYLYDMNKRRRDRRRRNGLCFECDLPALTNQTRCEAHRVGTLERTKRYQAKLAVRQGNGLESRTES